MKRYPHLLQAETAEQGTVGAGRERGVSMKDFMNEFKEFISRGNVMDMAVGIMIGGAFTAIVTSLVEDIISPILGVFGGLNFDQLKLSLGGEVTLAYGKFITAVINFLIMAFILFSIIKALNAAAFRTEFSCTALQAGDIGGGTSGEAGNVGFAARVFAEEEAAPTTKMCPYCKSEDVAMGATKCPHCASTLELSEEEIQMIKEAEEAAAQA